jgi:hypothetical protein
LSLSNKLLEGTAACLGSIPGAARFRFAAHALVPRLDYRLGFGSDLALTVGQILGPDVWSKLQGGGEG